MSKPPSITFVDYIDFYTGEFVQYINEGINTETNELLVLTRNHKQEFVAIPKDNFYENTILDASITKQIQKQVLQIESFEPTHYNENNSYYVIGKGVHLITNELLVFYFDSNQNFYLSPLQKFYTEFPSKDEHEMIV
ncbi:hypothetical protein [Bacillus thuringiensis]|uniref:hypothetical protein n=1 Tax=Bacillus thuringiensis TaxID=1428 RepID=UPI0021D67160|nr:hypothetical protein [Bacillus thuringiensis]MCU7667217.1 hypothetical protein [Bacillus thuringiensis]